jgi:fatty acid desaturase
MRAAGLLRRRPGWYAAKITYTLLALLATWALLLVIGNSWWALLDAAAVAVVTTQVVFLGHDAGHQQISSHPATNRRLGLVFGNLLTGLCLGWWVPKHTAHHTHPNQSGLDPDIGPGVVAFTSDVALRRRGVARLLLRLQSPLFFPLLLLEGVALQVTGGRYLVRRRDRAALVEAALLVVHLALFVGVVATVLSPWRAVAFIAVQQCLFGLYLGSTFAPNHKGMEIMATDAEVPFAERQIRTSRNVRGGRAITMAMGGLNFQIEHHIFPTMPRPNLVRARCLVQAFCTEHDLAYTETGLIESYRRVLVHLATVGRDDPTSRQPHPTVVIASLP